MAEKDNAPNKFRLDRRTLLQGGAATALAAPLGIFGAQALPFRSQSDIDVKQFPVCKTSSDTIISGPPRKLKFSWNAGAVCSVQIPVAIDQGFFKKRNLDVELVNFSGSTDQLLEAIATGKSDAGVGMALRWLKPLEQGFDVKIALGTHGGCLRAIVPAKSDIKTLTDLKGKNGRCRRSRRPGQEFLFDPACEGRHRSRHGYQLASVSRKPAAACGREGRGPRDLGDRPDRLSVAQRR